MHGDNCKLFVPLYKEQSRVQFLVTKVRHVLSCGARKFVELKLLHKKSCYLRPWVVGQIYTAQLRLRTWLLLYSVTIRIANTQSVWNSTKEIIVTDKCDVAIAVLQCWIIPSRWNLKEIKSKALNQRENEESVSDTFCDILFHSASISIKCYKHNYY